MRSARAAADQLTALVRAAVASAIAEMLNRREAAMMHSFWEFSSSFLLRAGLSIGWQGWAASC